MSKITAIEFDLPLLRMLEISGAEGGDQTNRSVSSYADMPGLDSLLATFSVHPDLDPDVYEYTVKFPALPEMQNLALKLTAMLASADELTDANEASTAAKTAAAADPADQAAADAAANAAAVLAQVKKDSVTAAECTVDSDPNKYFNCDGKDYYRIAIRPGINKVLNLSISGYEVTEYKLTFLARRDAEMPTCKLQDIQAVFTDESDRFVAEQMLFELPKAIEGPESAYNPAANEYKVNTELLKSNGARASFAYQNAMMRVSAIADGRGIPEAVCNEAVMRMVGYSVQNPPDRPTALIYERSGARAALEPYINKRAGAV